MEVASYDPETGEWFWRERAWFGRNRTDKPAGTVRADGYLSIKIDGQNYMAQRLAWLYVHGLWPTNVIDHINGDRLDNRLVNLRDVTQAENNANTPRSRRGLPDIQWKSKRRERVCTQVSLSTLTARLGYDPDTGIFTRRVARGRYPAGSVAGCSDHYGYQVIRIDDVLYKAHRLAWLYMTGEWPHDDIDHINGQPSDNRFSNLRQASAAQNLANRGLQKNNTTGVTGVYWERSSGKWMAGIMVGQRSINLGLHETFEGARSARRRAEEKYFGEFARVA